MPIGKTETSIYAWWECEILYPLWRTIWQFFIKLNLYLPDDMDILTLSNYLREVKIDVYKENIYKCSWQLLLLTVKNWNQDKNTLTTKWINQLWHIHRIEYYSTIKMSKLYTMTWISFKILYWIKEVRCKREHNYFIYMNFCNRKS